jgi:hypothetical protein
LQFSPIPNLLKEKNHSSIGDQCVFTVHKSKYPSLTNLKGYGKVTKKNTIKLPLNKKIFKFLPSLADPKAPLSLQGKRGAGLVY